MRKRFGVRWMAALAIAWCAPPTLAQEASPAEMEAVSASWRLLDEGQYLAAEQALKRVAFDAAGKPKPGFAYDQWSLKRGMMTGEPAPPAEPRSASLPPEDAPAVARLQSATVRDAIAAIVERAKNTRIVILNEDHAVPRDRAFGLQVARALRPLGYDVLAVETLNNQPDTAKFAEDMRRLAADGYPRLMTGTYLRDPVFADFLRQSLAFGYRPVAYEITDMRHQDEDWRERIARREQAQADYIVARALKAYPKSKIFIYVGFNHATENPQQQEDGPPNRWLATRLKAMTGIDPLTIDQTVFNDGGNSDVRLHAAVADRVGGEPAVLFEGDRPMVLGSYAGLVDLQVVHPRTKRVGGRPDWLAAMGRKPAPIPAELLPKRGVRLVQAFVTSEGEDAIPVDQVLVTAGEPAPMLMLPAAPVRYAVQDPAG